MAKLRDNNAFLYVGNLEKRKGTDLLLDGYLEYLKAGGTKDLRFAGERSVRRISKRRSDRYRSRLKKQPI